MQQYTFDRFLEHMAEAVLFYPNNGNDQVDAFIYVDNPSLIDTITAGTDERRARSLKYAASKFYLKNQTANFVFQYPALFVEDITSNVTNLFAPSGTRISSRVKLELLDLHKDSKFETQTRADRELPEVYRDTSNTLLKILGYLKQVVCAEITYADNTKKYDFWSKVKLDRMVATAEIVTYKIDEKRTAIFSENLMILNQENDMENIYMETGSQAAGTRIIINLPISYCEKATFDASFAENAFIYGQ